MVIYHGIKLKNTLKKQIQDEGSHELNMNIWSLSGITVDDTVDGRNPANQPGDASYFINSVNSEISYLSTGAYRQQDRYKMQPSIC